MKKLFSALFMIVLVVAIAGVVASIAARKRLESMSDDEIREFLATKLEGRVPDEQIATIQEAAISGIRKKSGSTAPVVEADADETEPVDAADEAEAVEEVDEADEVEEAEEILET